MDQKSFDEMLAALKRIAAWDWDFSGRAGGEDQAKGLSQSVVKNVEARQGHILKEV